MVDESQVTRWVKGMGQRFINERAGQLNNYYIISASASDAAAAGNHGSCHSSFFLSYSGDSDVYSSYYPVTELAFGSQRLDASLRKDGLR